tara:strand:+ start:482 stop:3199 length:2718 start_codon:yes stop_codon:yes gene_type:complete
VARQVPFRRTLKVSRYRSTRDPISNYFSFRGIQNPFEEQGGLPAYLRRSFDNFILVPKSINIDWSWAGFEGEARNPVPGPPNNEFYADAYRSATREDLPSRNNAAQLKWSFRDCQDSNQTEFNLLDSFSDLDGAEFEAYDFQTEVPWLADYFSTMAMLGYEAMQAVLGRDLVPTLEFGTVNPEYNFYAEEYEDAVASSNIPEAVLPNMYIYGFAGDQQFGAPSWQTSNSETLRGYDRLIKLSEFKESILPLYQCSPVDGNPVSPEICEDQREWLLNYSENVKSTSIDITSQFATEYYNSITPASQMDIYSRFNFHKNAFPMYIEMGFPTVPIGNLARAIENTDTSVNFVNGLFSPSAESINQDMCLTTQGIGTSFNNQRLRNWLEDDPIWMYYALGSEPEEAELVWFGIGAQDLLSSNPIEASYTESLKIIDYQQWLAGVRQDIDAAVISQDPEGDQPLGCDDFVNRARLRVIENMIENMAETNSKTYLEYLENKLCEHETIAYKLIKCATNDDGTKGNVIQNFYFPNTSQEDVIRYVDTQVKYNKKYTFELYAYAVVYGSKFTFRVNDNQTNLELTPLPPGQDGFEPVGAIVNVQSLPNPKIIEYPIFNSLQAGLKLYGINYRPIAVKDRPPMPPSFQVHAYQNNPQQVLLNIQSGGGEVSPFVGDRSRPWYIIEPEELTQGPSSANEILRHQKQYENYSLVYPQMEFSDEGAAEVRRMEIWRIEESDLPSQINNTRDLYRMFAGNLHKILDTSGNPLVPENERALGFDFKDTLESNKKYYYTVRAIDIHGNRSNPSLVWEVELLYRDGIYIPKIDVYTPPIVPKTTKEKKFARFLEIKAADIQAQVYEPLFAPTDEERQPGQKGLTEEQVTDNKFVVRVTSLDTARKFDINLSFTSKDILPES